MVVPCQPHIAGAPSASCARRQEIVPLFFANWELEFLHHLKHIFPYPPLFTKGLVSQQVGGMIGRHQRGAAVTLPMAPQSHDPSPLAEQPYHRRPTQSDNYLGANQVDLFMQIRD